ncbi:arrestin domain-containing protein 5-like [Spodoptera litura]|uniref:Arrestin domain-containing protein 5-like n=1 Tax=Spodoptera litura TaxID=69820 RepID=A0A9J7DP54_SPOLT|nr:arrestin domain-containing protein 5-like [Spodoptera litura]
MTLLCQILLEKAKEGVFRSGDYVRGTLKYSVDKPTRYETIYIRFVGHGSVSWSESDGDDRKTYSNQEEYADLTQYILKPNEDNVLNGCYDHPFEFLIPDDIPISKKDDVCNIYYKVVAIFVKTEGFIKTKKFDAEIPVYGYVNRCSPEPLVFGLQKELFSLTTTNKINVKAEIDKTFVTPGENITLKVTVNNNTDFPITVRTELVKRFTYRSSDDYTRVDTITVIGTAASSPPMKVRSVSNLTCIVPTLANLYSIQYSKIVEGIYKVKVTAIVPFPHINESVEIPVVIGEGKEHLGATAKHVDDAALCPQTPDESDKH